eukprot:2783358-Amphidinium_carterae.1
MALSATLEGFSNDPIFVKVIGPDVPCFTVVDMPGLKKFDPDNRKFNKDVASKSVSRTLCKQDD